METQVDRKVNVLRLRVVVILKVVVIAYWKGIGIVKLWQEKKLTANLLAVKRKSNEKQ